jgi:nucleotide-binding universal stress UspA family protein
MSILVAVTDSVEGKSALSAAIAEAQRLSTELVVFNLALSPLQLTSVPDGLAVRVIDRKGPEDRDPVDAVLDEISDDSAIERLVIGIKKRRPIGKALLGSISQRLLLEADVPILAVKVS